MQEHDINYVRVEMALAEAPPAGTSGLASRLRRNLFSTWFDVVLTIVAVLLLAYYLPPLIDWAFLSAQWTGTDRTFCATVAQGGIKPDDWSGACWAFVNAKFEQFMFGRYPASERWRVILTGVIFVLLLAPLMIPRAPKKGLNAVLLFAVFPFVAFMLMVGSAMPFGLIGLVLWLLGWLVWILGSLIYGILTIPAALVELAWALNGLFFNGSGGDGAVEAIRSFGHGVFRPFDAAADSIHFAGAAPAAWLGGRAWLWTDLALSAAAVLLLMRFWRFSARSIAATALALLLSAAGLWLVGLDVGLPYVETPLWGGLMVTLTLSFVGIAVSLPLGILLALGRRSRMPVVKLASVVFIETVRGVPLITVLFMASIMLPYFLPPGSSIDKFLRALVGVSLFASAYMAEVVRGGLQAIPKGQYEGADSLGLSYWQKMSFIILPQALRLVIPGIVNSFIGLFKDTSLVYIIAMFDLLGIVRQNFSDANWASPQTPMSGLVFAGFVFWLFCFGMSRYSIFMERRLDTGHKR